MAINDEDLNEKDVWNSLEVCKLLAGLLLPIAIAWYANSQQKANSKIEEDRRQTSSMQAKSDEFERREVQRRFEIWQQMAPLMDNIYSYFLYVGEWKSTTPEQIVTEKRKLDALIYTNRIFFSDAFFNSYRKFEDAAFKSYRGWAEDPQLRTVKVRPTDQNSSIAFADCDNGDRIYSTFWDFMTVSESELELPLVTNPAQPARPSGLQAESCPTNN